jgi:hypothetical protein
MGTSVLDIESATIGTYPPALGNGLGSAWLWYSIPGGNASDVQISTTVSLPPFTKSLAFQAGSEANQAAPGAGIPTGGSVYFRGYYHLTVAPITQWSLFGDNNADYSIGHGFYIEPSGAFRIVGPATNLATSAGAFTWGQWARIEGHIWQTGMSMKVWTGPTSADAHSTGVPTFSLSNTHNDLGAYRASLFIGAAGSTGGWPPLPPFDVPAYAVGLAVSDVGWIGPAVGPIDNALDAVFTSGDLIYLNTAPPGATGTAGRLNTAGPKTLTFSGAMSKSKSITATLPSWTNWADTNGALITHYSVYSSGGTFKFSGALSSPRTMYTGWSLSLGSLSITATGAV